MIAAIIITFKPDITILHKCISSLYLQIEKLIIVNNDEINCIKDLLIDFPSEKIVFVNLGKNFGIAYAQNRGIEEARQLSVDWILFSDQDTVYPQDYISKLTICSNKHNNEKIAAFVPLFYNENKKQYAQINIKKTKAIIPEIGNEYELSHAISSGTICPIRVFDDIGFMNERLFIDWVDFEWCWRATSKGYKIICDTNTVIRHNMGDSFKKILGRKIVIYSDFRNYFFFRNGTWLLVHSHLLNFFEWLGLLKFMFLKTILFFMTKGFSIHNIQILCRAVYKGIKNQFTIEEI